MRLKDPLTLIYLPSCKRLPLRLAQSWTAWLWTKGGQELGPGRLRCRRLGAVRGTLYWLLQATTMRRTKRWTKRQPVVSAGNEGICLGAPSSFSIPSARTVEPVSRILTTRSTMAQRSLPTDLLHLLYLQSFSLPFYRPTISRLPLSSRLHLTLSQKSACLCGKSQNLYRLHLIGASSRSRSVDPQPAQKTAKEAS